MSSNLASWMKVGIVHFMAFPETITGEGPVLETIAKLVADEFFDVIEITHIENAEVREQVANILKEAKFDVGFGAQPFQLGQGLDLNSADEGARKTAVSKLKRLIEEANAIGAKKFGILSGPDVPGNRAGAIELLTQSLEELCRYAAQYGIDIVLEIFDREIDKKRLIGSTQEAVEIAQTLEQRVSNFGLMLDQGHLPQMNEGVESLVLAKNYLKHVHIGNCIITNQRHPAYGDQHPRFGVEDGENDVPELVEFLRVLKDIGYIGNQSLGAVSFEVKPMSGETSSAVIANAKRTLKQAWAQV